MKQCTYTVYVTMKLVKAISYTLHANTLRIVNVAVLHRMREALQKRCQVRQGTWLLQEGAARPPPETLPILPPRQGARRFAKAAGGEDP